MSETTPAPQSRITPEQKAELLALAYELKEAYALYEKRMRYVIAVAEEAVKLLKAHQAQQARPLRHTCLRRDSRRNG
jgi:hypothetical protein